VAEEVFWRGFEVNNGKVAGITPILPMTQRETRDTVIKSGRKWGLSKIEFPKPVEADFGV